jgi:hypothetical protein
MKEGGASMAQLLNQTIKELRSLEPQELAAVHGMIRCLRRPRTTVPKSTARAASASIRQILKKCSGRLADDVRELREDRV